MGRIDAWDELSPNHSIESLSVGAGAANNESYHESEYNAERGTLSIRIIMESLSGLLIQ